MTQTTARFRVYGKDRLFDGWTEFTATTREEAETWLAQRGWVRMAFGEMDEPLIELLISEG